MSESKTMSLMLDTRPDLVEDSRAWTVLLSLCANTGDDPAGLYGTLRGIRSLGARLEAGRGMLRIAPGEMEVAEYIALRDEYLVPNQRKLAALLRMIGVEAA